MQIFVVGRGGAGVFPAATKDKKFNWNQEFHNLVESVRGKLNPDDPIAKETFEYYDKNLKGQDIIGEKGKTSPLWGFYEMAGFNMILGFLYMQNVILFQYSQYDYTTPNWNDVFAGYSAKGISGLYKAKKAMPIKDKAGWLPEGQPKAYAIGAKSAWAYFSGGKYGDGTYPTYEDDVNIAGIKDLDAAVAAVNQAVALEEFGATFDLFAKYEYYRMRYAQRSASVRMAFNPYVVPGFPCAIIDDPKNPVHLMGYVNAVSHSMSAQSGSPHMITQVSVSFVRTLEEYRTVGVGEDREVGANVTQETQTISQILSGQDTPIGLEPNDIIFQGNPNLTKEQWKTLEQALEERAKYIGHPFEPVWTVRDLFQHLEETHKLYSRLFYRATKDVGAPKKARKRNIFNPSDYFKTIFTGDEADFIARDMALGVATQEIRNTFAAEARSYDAAMRFVARPSCSLIDYVKIWNRQDKISILEGNGKVSRLKEKDIDAGGYRTVNHFVRIFRMEPGPIPPKFASKNKGQVGTEFIKYLTGLTNVNINTGSAGYEPPEGAVTRTGLPMLGEVNKNFGARHPEMRHDWNKTLEKYRGFVLHNVLVTGGEK